MTAQKMHKYHKISAAATKKFLLNNGTSIKKRKLTRQSRRRQHNKKYVVHSQTKKGGIFRNPFSILSKFKQLISRSDFGPCLMKEINAPDNGEEPLNVYVNFSKHQKLKDCSDNFFAHIEKPNNDALIKSYNGFSESDKMKLTREINGSRKKLFYNLMIGYITKYNSIKKEIDELIENTNKRVNLGEYSDSKEYEELLKRIKTELSEKDNLDTLHLLEMQGDAWMGDWMWQGDAANLEPPKSNQALKLYEEVRNRMKMRNNIEDDEAFDNVYDNLDINEKIANAAKWAGSEASHGSERIVKLGDNGWNYALKTFQTILKQRYAYDKMMRSTIETTKRNLQKIQNNMIHIAELTLRIGRMFEENARYAKPDEAIQYVRQSILIYDVFIRVYQSLYFQIDQQIKDMATKIIERRKKLEHIEPTHKYPVYTGSDTASTASIDSTGSTNSTVSTVPISHYSQIPAAGGRRVIHRLQKLTRKVKK